MSENQPNLQPKSSFFSFSRYTWIILLIIGISFSIRFYFFPYDIPLTADSLYYFWYSSDVFQIGGLPDSWSPSNNGWPIFVAFFFSAINSQDIFLLMEVQKLLSVITSVLIIIPVYFICKNFVPNKFAVIGASFIAFDPRLMINSFLGITDPLYLILITTSLGLFFSSNKKIIYFSFIPVSLSIIVRAEGLAFFVVLLIMFVLKYRKERHYLILKTLLILGIFLVITLPTVNYQNEVNGSNIIFSRNLDSSMTLISNISEHNSENRVIIGFETLVKYLIWVMIPNFIIFIPLGLFLIFRKRDFQKNTIILSLGLMILPALYAYSIPALDTRYLYALFPMFAVISVLAIEKIVCRFTKQNLIIVLLITAIIFSSIIFYDDKKIDQMHELESFEVMKEIAPNVKGVNNLSTESRYLQTIQTIDQWPKNFSNMKFDIKIISDKESISLDEFITNSKEKGLSHIMTDNNQDRKGYLKELFIEESKYPYLKKIYDSRDHGFDYQIKVFEINYDIHDSIKGN